VRCLGDGAHPDLLPVAAEARLREAEPCVNTTTARRYTAPSASASTLASRLRANAASTAHAPTV
jgi:hypothetical protein